MTRAARRLVLLAALTVALVGLAVGPASAHDELIATDPAVDRASALACRVRVLPVPVAPAIRSCRFIIDSGRPAWAAGTVTSFSTRAPSGSVGPAKVYPWATWVADAESPMLSAIHPNVRRRPRWTRPVEPR